MIEVHTYSREFSSAILTRDTLKFVQNRRYRSHCNNSVPLRLSDIHRNVPTIVLAAIRSVTLYAPRLVRPLCPVEIEFL